MTAIDINFDFQKEVGFNKDGTERDSDRFSPTLQEYHRALWSKPLPNQKLFELTKVSKNQLHHISALGEFYLSSDWGAITLSGRQQVKKYIHEVDQEVIQKSQRLVITIGARIIWPANRIAGASTINGAKGMNYFIADRLDLTIECIRRYYLKQESPLYVTLQKYDNFFQLFDGFKGYIDFFLLQDYVTDDYQSVKIAPPHNNFSASPIPTSSKEYLLYLDFTCNKIQQRNKRISRWASAS